MRKIIVHTTYDNCTDEWVDWYLNELNKRDELKECVADLKDGHTVGYKSEHDGMTAQTTYVIIPPLKAGL